MTKNLVNTIIHENEGVTYTAKIYESNSYHYVDFFKNDTLIDTKSYPEKSEQAVNSIVNEWVNGIKVLKG